MLIKESIHYQHIEEKQGLIISEATLAQFHFQPHFHLDYHIGLVTHGVLHQTHKGQSMNLAPQQVCFMPPGEVHDGASRGSHPYQLTTFRISPELLEKVLLEETLFDGDHDQTKNQLEHLAPALIDHAPLAQAFLNLNQAFKPNNQASQLYKDSLWTNTLAGLFALAAKTPTQEEHRGLRKQQLNQLREYCEANLENKITLDELANLTGFTRFQFIRRFQKQTGIAPHAWLLRLRLERACTSLNSSHTSITDIAADVGFYDQSHFNRAFKNAYQIAPSRYRYGV